MAKARSDARTRRRLLEILKTEGPSDAQNLAEEVGITPMAVRQHLYQLQEEKLVTYREEPRPVGRPAKLWELTAEANRFFPDAHATLAVDLLSAMKESFGAAGLEKIVERRRQEQADDYLERIPKRASLKTRLEKLVSFRTEEGYMAELQEDEEGWLLIENHCPICSAASMCTGLCAAELDVFQMVLGDRAEIARSEHILEGARRCVYRVKKVGSRSV